MDQIDVVMTATVRPDVLELTLFSFFRHFLFQFARTRLIINIDPIGELRQNCGRRARRLPPFPRHPRASLPYRTLVFRRRALGLEPGRIRLLPSPPRMIGS